ncbi:hypothetical protein BZA05DRAFT_382331 [Tricharina praecox]|uniref:uncharacterized protein n=1 Tax=Tricharina praecox TaxID=43433 RepID=UPI00221F7CC4|nr:uncharacterized protein BZA05DRAFT_382331 [Tricharina praecox]KAI5858748.1 hypothetical protein BZA05DRAFT_382331 [Tricharina praecox]
METDASTGAGPSSLDVSADDIPRPPGVHAPNEEGSRGKRRERIETSPESEDPTLSSEPSMISSSGVDRAFSADDFNASNWAVYGDDLPDDYRDADTDEIDEEDEEDDDVYNDEYLADGEPDFNNSEASDPSGQGDYPPNPPPNLPLRPLVARHIPVDGTSETEVGIDIVNEDPEYTAFNPGPALHDSTIPLPNSSRFHPRLLDTMNSPSSSRMAILNDRDVVAATLGHIDHRYVGMNRYLGRSAVSLSQDDAMDSSYRRWSSATAPAGNDIDDSSDDSFSGFQLPADTIAELEERKRRRQAEAAKRTIR